jgi:hypothetical protein
MSFAVSARCTSNFAFQWKPLRGSAEPGQRNGIPNICILDDIKLEARFPSGAPDLQAFDHISIDLEKTSGQRCIGLSRLTVRRVIEALAVAPVWLAASLACLALTGCMERGTQKPATAADETALQPQQFAGYTVHVDPDNPQRLLARLDLSSHDGTDRTAHVRGLNFGLVSQVADPSCDEVSLLATGDGQWAIPDDCCMLSWFIDMEPTAPNGVDTSLQRSLVFSGGDWWLLSEPTSLLRISGPDRESMLRVRFEGLPESSRIAGATRVEQGVWRLPGLNHAPEFFAFGNLVLEQHDVGRLQATYVIDDQDRFGRLNLPALHRQALAYLANVFQVPTDLPAADRHLLVIWLGIDESLGHAGGAAGSRSFLANYVDGGDEGLDMNLARTMLILAHEQTHQLHDLTWPGGTPGPTWLGESIAHYYGLKALARSGLPDEVVGVVMNFFIDPTRPVEAGLVEYERRYEAGDTDAYQMFYAQGATFWSEVDRVLLSVAPASGGLDALIPDFVQSPASDEGLPRSFQQLLLEQGGEEMRDLLARYVGE